MLISLKITHDTPQLEVYDIKDRCIGIFSGDLEVNFNEAMIWIGMWKIQTGDTSEIMIDPLIIAIDKIIPKYKWDGKKIVLGKSKANESKT